MTIETRAFVEPVEFRGAEGNRIVASGVAMRYGAKSKPIGGQFREQFMAGTFARSLGRQDVRSHNEHSGPYLARTSNESLRITDDRSEMAYELDLPDTSAGRDAAALLERRDIKGSSIGFRAIPKGVAWARDDDGMALRTVSEASLHFIDLTTEPAYDDSTAELALRSFAQETGIELRSVQEAAATGHLADLIDPPEGVDLDDPDALTKIREFAASLGVTDLASLAAPSGDADPPVARPRISWLTA